MNCGHDDAWVEGHPICCELRREKKALEERVKDLQAEIERMKAK